MSNENVQAAPTKAFFVKMLTRDIELRDAILDLLDNCIDGLVRSLQSVGSAQPSYRRYVAKITADPRHFRIEDNCGGIPVEIARNVAFRLGRPEGAHQESLQTVGVYGIGMKRAIFKLGENAKVISEHKGQRFEVAIPKTWLSNDDSWDLKMKPLTPTGKEGTIVEVTNLYPGIAREFDTEKKTFLNDLGTAISEVYSIILQRGFSVSLNGCNIAPVTMHMLTSANKKDGFINPYVFSGKFGDVNAEVVVGFYRKPLSEKELDDESDSPKADLSCAGWNIVCNDRLVLRADKTALTGWGTAGVPRFHNQFSSIAGTVTLSCNDPSHLPLNTTKRGVETSSDIYYRLLDYMREGTKIFTSYTNVWKTKAEDVKEHFQHVSKTEISGVKKGIARAQFKTVSARKLAAPDSEGKVFTPKLPKPRANTDGLKKIVFSKPVNDIKILAADLFDSSDVTPSEVGERCFDLMLIKLNRAGQRS